MSPNIGIGHGLPPWEVGVEASLGEVGFGFNPQPLSPSVVGGVSADFTEDFSTYADTADFLNDPNGYYDETADASTSEMALDTGVGFGSLTQSIRYDYSWQGNCSIEQTIRRSIDFSLPAVLGQDVAEVWYQVDAMFQGVDTGQPAFDTTWPNRGRAKVNNISGTFQEGERISFSTHAGNPFLKRIDDIGNGELVLWWSDVQNPEMGETITGDTSGATADCMEADKGCTQTNDFKFIFIKQSGGTGRWGINIGLDLNRRILVEAPTLGSCYDTVCNDNILGRSSDDGLTECEFAGYNVAGGDWGPRNLFDGTFHEFRFHAKSSSSDTAADGELEVWIDQEKLFEVLDIKMCADLCTQLDIGQNFGRPGFNMSLWWGRVQLWTSDPGWV